MIQNSREKLKKKNVDMIAANNLKQAGAGFGTDTNVITLITEKQTKKMELMTKEKAAQQIIDEILRCQEEKRNGEANEKNV